MYKISVDPGYGYVKAISESGKQVRFPSLAAPSHDRFLTGLLDSHGNGDLYKELVVHYEDEDIAGEFFVGDLAKQSRFASSAYDENKINHIHTKVFLASAALLLAPDQEKIWIGCGLPLEHFKVQREEMQDMLHSFRAKVRIFGKTRDISFEKVSIFAQGASSVYDALMYPNGHPRYPELLRKGSQIAMINWGTRTVDVVVFKVDDAFQIQPELSFTLDDYGAMEIRRMLQQTFSKETGYTISLLEAEQILQDKGLFYYKGKEYNFSSHITVLKKHLTRLVFDSIKSRWGAQSGFIRTVFFSGGTVEDVKDAVDLTSFHHDVHLVEDPQFADARGVLYMMRLQQMKRKGDASLVNMQPVSAMNQG